MEGQGEHETWAQHRQAQPGFCCTATSSHWAMGQSFRGVYGLVHLSKSTLVLYLKVTGMFN